MRWYKHLLATDTTALSMRSVFIVCVCVRVNKRKTCALKTVHHLPPKTMTKSILSICWATPDINGSICTQHTHTHNTKVTWWIGTVRPNADVHTRNRIVQHEHELHSAVSLTLQYIQLHTATADHKTTATNKPRARQSIHLLPFRLSGKIHSVAEMRLWYVHRTRVQA